VPKIRTVQIQRYLQDWETILLCQGAQRGVTARHAWDLPVPTDSARARLALFSPPPQTRAAPGPGCVAGMWSQTRVAFLKLHKYIVSNKKRSESRPLRMKWQVVERKERLGGVPVGSVPPGRGAPSPSPCNAISWPLPAVLEQHTLRND